VGWAAEIFLVGILDSSQMAMRDRTIAVDDVGQLGDLSVYERSLLAVELKSLQFKVVLAQLIAIRVLRSAMVV
jgi:hypothetical protein